MKYLALAITLFISACASNIKTSQPVSGINSPIRVIGTGYTMEQAKNNGFTSAIEFAVGSVVLTDIEVRGNNLVRDEIIKHSAGYVDAFKIVEQTHINGQYQLVMDVDVKSSRIHERLLGKSKSSVTIEGERMSNQYSSYMKERQTGDQVLNKLLYDFPHNAMVLTQGKTQFMLDGYRNPVLVIPFEIRWNYKYLTAFNEALNILEEKSGDRPDSITIMSKNPNSLLLGETNVYRFNDGVRFDRIRDTLNQQIKIQASILDINSKVIYSACYSSSQTFRGNYSTTKYVVYGNDVERDHIRLMLDENLQKKFKTADRVELTIKGKTC